LKIKDRAFQKYFFYCSKSIKAAATANLRKTAVLTLSKKKGIKKNIFHNFFFDSDSFKPGDYHAKKNKSEKIILSAPKTAATLIIAATLNSAPTVGPIA
jgi:hypothetical protein